MEKEIMTPADIQRQLDATAQDPFKSMMVVYGCRAFALVMLVVWFFVRISNPWIEIALALIFSVSFWLAGYIDARQHYKGQLWIATLNLERMTVQMMRKM